jgi:hypothetical protein
MSAHPSAPGSSEGRPDSELSEKSLIAYELGGGMKLRPAETEREWMNRTLHRFARRCLPLLMANASGWELLCPSAVTLTWKGDNAVDGVQIDPPTPYVKSHFGYGIVTFYIPFVFRTPPGVSLLLRGPANLPKDGLSPLEGLVETDWTPAPFAMNWKFTRTTSTGFERDEPIAMLVPQQRGDLESYAVYTAPLSADPDVDNAVQRWSASRTHYLEKHLTHDSWQKDYIQGRDAPPGQPQRRRRLAAHTDAPTTGTHSPHTGAE